MILVKVKSNVDVSRRELNEATKFTLRKTLEEHHHRHIPKHFTHAGAREYGYKPRKGEKGNIGRFGFKGSYTARKKRQFGHTRPLEFSGLSKALSRIRDVRATSKSARLILPAGFNRKHPKSEINMRDEITAVSAREEVVLTQIADQQMIRSGVFDPRKPLKEVK